MSKACIETRNIMNEKHIKSIGVNVNIDIDSIEDGIGLCVGLVEAVKNYICDKKSGMDKLCTIGMLVEAILKVIKSEILEDEDCDLPTHDEDGDFSSETKRELSTYLEKCFNKEVDSDK